MHTNDSGNPAIQLKCFCSGKHCQGELYIQPDTIDDEKVFMVSAVDISGNEEGNLWLSYKQIGQLIEELQILLYYER